MSPMNNLSTVILTIIVISLSIYLLPSIIVIFNRRKRAKIGVIILNIFLGWTFVGWIIALVLALQADTIVIYEKEN